MNQAQGAIDATHSAMPAGHHRRRNEMLQEACTALKTEDYAVVTRSLNGAAGDLQAALTQIDAVTSGRPSPRKR